ncbi:MAG: hypothetical protein AUJ04_04355 [Acidobacteria bacterium 13_1_40CM_3_55_6]|nr:MAG: hypothetical protein AUJ04_04355 [Acidobacteria bacterium 13_1_40CM_3_55_6]
MSFAAEYVEQIEAQLGDEWMGRIYRERILKMRTRAYEFASLRKAATPEIHHTLLGIELKIGRRRTLCPDLATARYLAVFARLGSQAVAIPYDITKISLVADELERSWHRMLLLADSLTTDRTPAFRTRLRKLLIAKVRAEIAAAGPGPRIPEFKQTTIQREPPPKGTKCAKEFQNRER